MTSCVLVRNPASRGRLSDKALAACIDALRGGGWDVTLAETEREGHAIEIARDAAARGIDVVMANGGDGTINEVINGIARTETALAVLPSGTANVWAHEIKVKKKPLDAIQAALDGERRTVDLGVANGRYFLLMASVGFDALVVPRVNTALKRRVGAGAYIISGARAIFGATHWHAEIRIDDDVSATDLYWLLVSNTRSYGGITDILFKAQVDDGLLDVGLMHRGGVRRIVVDGVRVLRKKIEDSANIDYMKARTVEIMTPGIAIQLDGEAAGETPVLFECAPGALHVIVPRGLRSPLFAGGGQREPPRQRGGLGAGSQDDVSRQTEAHRPFDRDRSNFI